MIEIRVSGAGEEIEFDRFALPIPGLTSDYWQVPFDEQILTEGPARGDFDACFFLYVVNDELFETPAGPMVLPPITEMPAHLRHIEFEEPC